jgi:hypothetical protein
MDAGVRRVLEASWIEIPVLSVIDLGIIRHREARKRHRKSGVTDLFRLSATE